jgi:hypothetical protein
MDTIEEGQFINLSAESTPAQLKVIEFTKEQRIDRAAKRLGLFWGIGILCILIPFLHFFLVPSFLIVGIYALVTTLEEHKFILSADGLCPSCKKNISFRKLKYKLGLKDVCPQCRQDLKISVPARQH